MITLVHPEFKTFTNSLSHPAKVELCFACAQATQNTTYNP